MHQPTTKRVSVGLTERVREHACLGHRQSDTLVVNGKRWVCVEVRERERERERGREREREREFG